jgi:predicted acetyltransferase
MTTAHDRGPRVSLRQATLDDMSVLQRMYAELLLVLAESNPTVDPAHRLQTDWVERPGKLWAWLIEKEGGEKGGGEPPLAGFALVCGTAYAEALGSPTDYLLYEYFIESSERRSGLGRAALETLLRDRPGTWSLDVLPGNEPAMAFWTASLARYEPEVSVRVDDEGVTFVRHHFRVPVATS